MNNNTAIIQAADPGKACGFRRLPTDLLSTIIDRVVDVGVVDVGSSNRPDYRLSVQGGVSLMARTCKVFRGAVYKLIYDIVIKADPHFFAKHGTVDFELWTDVFSPYSNVLSGLAKKPDDNAKKRGVAIMGVLLRGNPQLGLRYIKSQSNYIVSGRGFCDAESRVGGFLRWAIHVKYFNDSSCIGAVRPMLEFYLRQLDSLKANDEGEGLKNQYFKANDVNERLASLIQDSEVFSLMKAHNMAFFNWFMQNLVSRIELNDYGCQFRFSVVSNILVMMYAEGLWTHNDTWGTEILNAVFSSKIIGSSQENFAHRRKSSEMWNELHGHVNELIAELCVSSREVENYLFSREDRRCYVFMSLFAYALPNFTHSTEVRQVINDRLPALLPELDSKFLRHLQELLEMYGNPGEPFEELKAHMPSVKSQLDNTGEGSSSAGWCVVM